MPQPLPPGAAEWQVEDQYLFLGSTGWYGLEKVKEYSEKLRLHRLKFRQEMLEDLTAELGPEAALRVFESWTRGPEPPVPPVPPPSPKRDPYERRRRLGLERKYSRILLPIEIKAIKSIDRYLEYTALPNCYFLGHEIISIVSPGLSDYIDLQGPQWMRDLLEYRTAVAVGRVLKARRVAGAWRPLTVALPDAREKLLVAGAPSGVARAFTREQLEAAAAAVLPSVVVPQIRPEAGPVEKFAARLFGATE